MNRKEKITIELAFIVCLLIVALIFWAYGFYQGFQSGFLEGSKSQFEQCGFYYDYTTGNYIRDITRIKINFTIFENETKKS